MTAAERIKIRRGTSELAAGWRAWGWCAIVLGLISVAGSCAQNRWAFPAPWRAREGGEPLVDEQSTVGRVRKLHALAEQAGRMSPPESAETARELQRQLQSQPPMAVKMAIVRVLGELQSPASLDGLQLALQDEDPRLRESACLALKRIDSPAALDLLGATAVNDQSVDVRLVAIRGLGNYRNPAALQALGKALDDRDPAVQYVAMESLGRVTGESLGQDVRKWKELAQRADGVDGSVLRR